MLLRKGVYPYEYMDSWEKFHDPVLLPKKALYSNLNFEDIQVNIMIDMFKDTLLLVDIYENFRNMCLDMYELDPVYFVSAPGLAWQACLKKTGVELELLTDIDMLLMIEKGTSQATWNLPSNTQVC